MVVNCPGGTNSLRFVHEGSWAIVCVQCDALVQRGGTRYPGATVDMPMVEDLAPLRIGDVGSIGNEEFRITGRVRVETERGHRNFWSVRGRAAFQWITQAFGGYALMAVHPGTPPKEDIRGIRPLRTLRIDETGKYQVEMLDRSPRYAWQGELMHALPMPWEVEVEAGRDPDGKVLLLIERSGRITTLAGTMVEFAELRIAEPIALARWT